MTNEEIYANIVGSNIEELQEYSETKDFKAIMHLMDLARSDERSKYEKRIEEEIINSAIEFGKWLKDGDYFPNIQDDWIKRAGNLVHGKVIDRKTTEELYSIYLLQK